jgi:hypothetical protein
MYRSTYPGPRQYLEMSGQLLAPAALSPGNKRLSGPQNRSGRLGEKKNLAPTGTRSPTPRPANSGYTDRAIPAHSIA